MNNLSPWRHRLNITVIKLKSSLFPRENFIREVFDCYQNTLPSIEVDWKRDNDFIVGYINTNDNEKFIAQGKTAQEFIDTVNDTIYAAYDIKPQYISKLGKNYYFPPEKELLKLQDKNINHSSFGFKKPLVPATN